MFTRHLLAKLEWQICRRLARSRHVMSARLYTKMADGVTAGLDSTQVALLDEECILVDRYDKKIGNATKKSCHLLNNINKGMLHRAFSVFLFNKEGELLLQQRADSKITFPDHWTNTCCSHPLNTEAETETDGNLGVIRAAQRKLKHELGIDLEQIPLSNFHHITRIHYKSENVPNDGHWGEHEIDYILFIQTDVDVKENTNEVKAYKYVNQEELNYLMEEREFNGMLVTPWFRLVWENFLSHWWTHLEESHLIAGDEKIHRMVEDGSDKDEQVICISGLSWTSTIEDVLNFLEGVNVVDGSDGIQLKYSTGEAYVTVESEEDVEKVFAIEHRVIGKRRIEVIRSGKSEMDAVMNPPEFTDAVVRLRGVPYRSTTEDISHFFTGLEIVSNGITMLTDNRGQATGEAYVQFVKSDAASIAQRKHREYIGQRYIEVFQSNIQELRQAVVRNAARGGSGGMGGAYDRFDRDGDDEISTTARKTDHIVHMEGLPYSATERNVREFFVGLNPVNVVFHRDRMGLVKGKCDVNFATYDEAKEAMKKHRCYMGPRYIELWLNS